MTGDYYSCTIVRSGLFLSMCLRPFTSLKRAVNRQRDFLGFRKKNKNKQYKFVNACLTICIMSEECSSVYSITGQIAGLLSDGYNGLKRATGNLSSSLGNDMFYGLCLTLCIRFTQCALET